MYMRAPVRGAAAPPAAAVPRGATQRAGTRLAAPAARQRRGVIR
jgi:hypothetical protein